MPEILPPLLIDCHIMGIAQVGGDCSFVVTAKGAGTVTRHRLDQPVNRVDAADALVPDIGATKKSCCRHFVIVDSGAAQHRGDNPTRAIITAQPARTVAPVDAAIGVGPNPRFNGVTVGLIAR